MLADLSIDFLLVTHRPWWRYALYNAAECPSIPVTSMCDVWWCCVCI